MTRDEIIQLLGGAACYDSRKPSEGMVNAWLETAQRARWTYNEATDAVKTHYTESTDFILPAHVAQRIKAARNDAAMRRAAETPDPAGQAKVARAITGAFQVVDEQPAKQWVKTVAAAKREAQERRKRVLAHPDLAAKLTHPPLNLTDPLMWNGYIPPKTLPGDDGNPYNEVNKSPIRQQLVEIATEALRRETETAS